MKPKINEGSYNRVVSELVKHGLIPKEYLGE